MICDASKYHIVNKSKNNVNFKKQLFFSLKFTIIHVMFHAPCESEISLSPPLEIVDYNACRGVCPISQSISGF